MDALNYIAIVVLVVLVVSCLILVARRSRRLDDPARTHQDPLLRGEGDAAARQAQLRRKGGRM